MSYWDTSALGKLYLLPYDAPGLSSTPCQAHPVRAATETVEKAATNAPRPEMTSIDPTRLPPAYRERVQTYFRKLSEK